MTDQVRLIVQLPAGSSVAEQLRDEPPASVSSGAVLLEHLDAGTSGRLRPPGAGEIVATVPSPEALRRQADAITRQLEAAKADEAPLTVIVEAAEYLREDELAALLAAARQAERVVILRILEGIAPG